MTSGPGDLGADERTSSPALSFELTEIDHVAIAVRDLDAAVRWYEETLGATVSHRERIESDGVEEALLRVADSYVQLLTPTRRTHQWPSTSSAAVRASTTSGTA